MFGGMDLVALRELVGGVLNDFAGSWRHQDIGIECERLGLPEPPPEGECSKRVRVAHSLGALLRGCRPPGGCGTDRRGHDAAVIGPGCPLRHRGRTLGGPGHPEIPKRIRRELARDLDRVGDGLTRKADRFMALLERLWDVNGSPLGLFGHDLASLRGQIEQHVFRNPGDWSLRTCSRSSAHSRRATRGSPGSWRGCLRRRHPRRTGPAGRRRRINRRLRPAGAELRETGIDGGYPVFSVVPARGP